MQDTYSPLWKRRQRNYTEQWRHAGATCFISAVHFHFRLWCQSWPLYWRAIPVWPRLWNSFSTLSFYPERTVTVTTRDPDYMTAGIKAKLRRKNRLTHAGRVEEADALAVRIGKDIASRNKTRLSHIDSKVNAKDMWAAYRQLTGGKQQVNVVDGITAESLNNQHYAAISTDSSYQPPPCKHTAAPNVIEVVSEWRIFNILDNLCATATGLDRLYHPGFCDLALHCSTSRWHICSMSLYQTVLFHVSGKLHPLAQCQRYHHLPAFPISPNIYHISTHEPSRTCCLIIPTLSSLV